MNDNRFVLPSMQFDTASEAWEFWYGVLSQMGLNDDSRDGNVAGEIINAVTHITDPTRNFVTSPIRRLPIRYAVGELLWYLSGSNKVNDIANFSKVWEDLSDDGETANSAYGYRIWQKFGFDQWDFVLNKLKADPMSRQAVIHIKDADNTPTKDMPCTVALQFLLRDGKLNMLTNMRSNDLWTGFPYDVFAFTSMQILMAFQLGVGIGIYTHVAGSLHLYARNLVEAEENAKRNK